MDPPTQADFAAADAALPRAAAAAMARVGLSPSMLAAVAERDDATLLRALLDAGVLSAIERVQIVAWARRTQAAAAMQPPSHDAAPAAEMIVKNPVKTFTFASFRASLVLEKQRRREAALAEQMRINESAAPPPAEAAARAPQRPFKSALQSPDPGTNACGMYPMGSGVGAISGTDADAAAANAALIAANLAAAADPDAVFARGVVYATGAGAAHDAPRARECFERAAALGHIEAAFKVASMYESGGGGVKQDWGQAARFYRMAADGGDADAMFSLARLKELGLDGEVSLLSRIGNAIRTGAASASAATSTPHDSVAEAAQLYGAAAELGHVRSAVALADLLTRGAGMARDVPRAVQLLRTAGGAAVWRHWDTSICPLDSMGDIAALLRLGSLLESATPAALPPSSALDTAASASPAAPSASSSTGSPPAGASDFDSASPLDSAAACYQRAAELGSAPALVRLGAVLQRRGGADNSARAARAFREAAEAGDPEAMYCLAAGMAVRARARAGISTSSHTDGVEASAAATPSEPSVAELEAEAARWLRRAADLKYEPAIIKLMLGV